MQLRLLTFNIHKGIGGIDRRYRPERIVETISHYEPDIVFLQEVDDGVPRSRMHRQVDWLADELGFAHRAFQANVKLRRGVYGNAILSHLHLDDVHELDLTVGVKKRRGALIAKVHVKDFDPSDNHTHTRTVIISNVHLGLAGFERKRQIQRLLTCDTILHAHHDTPLVIAGDFNDVWKNLGARLHLRRRMLSALGAKTYTFPAAYPLRSLDGIYYSGTIRLLNCYAGHTKVARQASDHLPVIADFEVYHSMPTDRPRG